MSPFVIALSIVLTATVFEASASELAAVPAPPPVAARNTGGLMNPDISLDGLFAFSQFNWDNPLVIDKGHDPHFTGFNIQQVELSFTSNVDPYFRADANLVLTTEGIEIEEAYATTLDLPASLQVKAGQFLTAFGRSNPTHPHTWNWADKPLILGRFFGGDGLRNPGAQVSWLSPLPWYSELIGSVQNGMGENAVSFNPGGSMRTLADAIYLLRWNNFVSLSDSLSLNWGASFLYGPNYGPNNGMNSQGPGNHTRIIGGDLYLRFRPVDGLGYISLQIEALQRYFDDPSEQFKDFGGYAELGFRLPQPQDRWHVGVRLDWVGPKNAPVITAITSGYGGLDPDTSRRYRISPVVTFYPTEFSKLRLQYNYDKAESFDVAQHVATAQIEFVVGAHGAHKF